MQSLYTLTLLIIITITGTHAFAACNPDINISKPDNIYTDNNDGTVTDSSTGLMWQKCTFGQAGNDCSTGTALIYTWQAALAIANINTNNSYTNWRLPNKNELDSLLESACSAPAINTTVFPSTISTIMADYWSASPYAGDNTSVWVVNFNNGVVFNTDKSNSRYLRLVRKIQ